MSINSLLERKILVLDTSSLIAFPEILDTIMDSTVLIPLEVLEELDNIKTYKDQAGMMARQVNRKLDSMRQFGCLFNGIDNQANSKVYVVSNSSMACLPSSLADTVDNKIISIAKQAKSIFDDVTLISEDIALRVKCDSLNIACHGAKVFAKSVKDDSYLGFQHLDISQEIMDMFYQEGEIVPKEFGITESYYPNEFLILKSGQSSALARVRHDGLWRKLDFVGNAKKIKVSNISPRNKEQTLALELLLDPAVAMVTLTGMAGSGKTIMAISAALQELQAKNYSKIVISRPAESTSKEIGFLPGSLEDKMMPWMQPIMDNLKILLGKNGSNYISMMFEHGEIEVESLSYIRGRSFQDTYLIIDEAQNISASEAKALITRMGNKSKIVLIGDLEQIDSCRVTQKTSGLGIVVEKFKDFEASGHITLLKGERSKLATYAAKIM